MTKPRVVISHWVHPEVIERLEQRCEVVTNQTSESLPRSEVLARTESADALMAFMPDSVDEAFLGRCARLKVVAGALKGYDNFDVGACTRHGVWLSNVPDLLTAPTAELTVALMLAVGRHLIAADRHVRSGAFAGWRPRFYGTGLAGRTVGIVGMGAVGRALAERLSGFGVQLLYADPVPLQPSLAQAWRAQHVTFDEIIAHSHFVVTLTHLDAGTQHLIDAGVLTRMRPDAYLINPGRGSLVDELAVADALAAGHLAGYAADVFEMEDWARADRPTTVPAALRQDESRTCLTPHIGSAVDEVRRDIALEAAANILDVLDGRPPRNAVNEARLGEAAPDAL